MATAKELTLDEMKEEICKFEQIVCNNGNKSFTKKDGNTGYERIPFKELSNLIDKGCLVFATGNKIQLSKPENQIRNQEQLIQVAYKLKKLGNETLFLQTQRGFVPAESGADCFA